MWHKSSKIRFFFGNEILANPNPRVGVAVQVAEYGRSLSYYHLIDPVQTRIWQKVVAEISVFGRITWISMQISANLTLRINSPSWTSVQICLAN